MSFFEIKIFFHKLVDVGGDKAFFVKSHDHMISESRDSVGEIPSSQITKFIVRAREVNNENIYMYYKSGQACVTNWGSFIITN